jgi:leader peptidase (prepilin peptidase)/N-methyltransferase
VQNVLLTASLYTSPDGGQLPHGIAIAFLFALGACVGSFLNVVVWRLPRGESLVSPPSHCPKCDRPLKWYDNVPIFGWLKLRGRCRFCREPISARYPIVELATALLFVFYYVMYYMADVGPCAPIPELRWSDAPGSAVYRPPTAPILLLHLFVLSSLLAASLIDAERYEIPQQITWLMAAVAILAHAVFDGPRDAGALNLVRPDGSPSAAAALAAGGAVGLALSLLLAKLKVLKPSFPAGEPLLDVEREAAEAENERLKREGAKKDELIEIPPPYTRRQVAREMRKEMAFLLPPLALAAAWWLLTARVPAVGSAWASAVRPDWASGLLGALFGALVGGLVVWLTRILGTLGFGRVAMGLGDVDLMFAVGAAIGAGAATVAFFLAPFFGIVLALYLVATGRRREVPYGPYLAMASAFVMLCYCPIAAWLEPGLAGLGLVARQLVGGSGGAP